ncbi:MAG: crossover junction endodeoxyribonuclease RuvC [Bryobacteraceae bacterium]|nr:crossover junction endodeoxyribonuclease RuvC [Bryobacteraceae bacterium]MDW8380377.1 crossover junction endodeoxyribonuclease RuvC [Bryobacterales bacterium]
MRILGIDCGGESTGYGVIDSDGRQHQLVASGVIRTKARTELSTRLVEIGHGLQGVIEQHRPDCAAVEEVFCSANARSALVLSHVRGVVLFLLAQAGLPVGEYSPLEVKTSVVGYGRAEKRQVQFMVQSILGLPQTIGSEDAADAVAVAICHAHHAANRKLVGAC